MTDLSRTDMEFQDKLYSSYKQAQNTVTLTGTTTSNGGIGTVDVFTVTGDVLAKVFAVCTTSCTASGGTLELGVTGATAGLIAQTTTTAIAASEIWHDASPDERLELSSVSTEKIIANGTDIFLTVGSATATAGVVRFNCLWKPLSRDGKVVSA